MPERVTHADRRATHPRSALVQAALILAGFAVAGALAGLLWVWVWSPPTGFVLDGRWARDEAGLRGDFAGTGWYVVIAVLSGLLLGALAAVLFDRHELITLVAVAIGSVVAAWLMLRVGLSLSPPDPDRLAASAEEGTRIPGRLRVTGESPYIAFPAGSLLGLMVVFIGLSRHRREQG